MNKKIPKNSPVVKKYRKFLRVPTQFAGVLGCDHYLRPQQIKNEIENGYEYHDNLAIQFGYDHESIAKYYYQKLFQTTIIPAKFRIDPQNPRIGGIADGLLDAHTGIEIKCHVGSEPLSRLPYKFLVQMAGYLYLYQRTKWILFSCTFKPDHTLDKYRLFEITWDQVKDRWHRDWYPQLTDFTQTTKWVNT